MGNTCLVTLAKTSNLTKRHPKQQRYRGRNNPNKLKVTEAAKSCISIRTHDSKSIMQYMSTTCVKQTYFPIWLKLSKLEKLSVRAMNAVEILLKK